VPGTLQWAAKNLGYTPKKRVRAGQVARLYSCGLPRHSQQNINPRMITLLAQLFDILKKEKIVN
jgi:hypothetical protein